MNKELEALNDLWRNAIFLKKDISGNVIPNALSSETNKTISEQLNVILLALERKEKLEKAWEIIVKKKIRVDLEVKPFDNYKEYTEYWNIKEGSFYGLTETEFNLLKEMLR